MPDTFDTVTDLTRQGLDLLQGIGDLRPIGIHTVGAGQGGLSLEQRLLKLGCSADGLIEETAEGLFEDVGGCGQAIQHQAHLGELVNQLIELTASRFGRIAEGFGGAGVLCDQLSRLGCSGADVGNLLL